MNISKLTAKDEKDLEDSPERVRKDLKLSETYKNLNIEWFNFITPFN